MISLNEEKMREFESSPAQPGPIQSGPAQFSASILELVLYISLPHLVWS